MLIFLFCVGMGVATFIENDFGTPAARKLVFDAFWFEAVMVLLAVNFIGNISKYRMWRRASWPSLLFHVAFVVVIIGAGISRLFSFEGNMHIREGQSSQTIVSDKTYIEVEVNGEIHEKELLLTPITNNDFSMDVNATGSDVTVEYVKYLPHAVETYEASENGVPIFHVVTAGTGSGRINLYLRQGEVRNVMGTTLSFDAPGVGDIQILTAPNDTFYIRPHHDMSFLRMADQSRGTAIGDSLNLLEQQALYLHENQSFVFKEFLPNAILKLMPSDLESDKNLPDALVVKVKKDDQSQEVVLTGRKGLIGKPQSVRIGGQDVHLRYGSKEIATPFAIHLKDFQLERYPGSMSPASYASEVVVKDEEEEFPFRIYMNNVLDHKGYRFFQASYDNDELGTVLSVNHDFWGTWVTYFGYALMILGMLIAPFWPGSRFKQLASALRSKSAISLAFILCTTVAVNAQSVDSSAKHSLSADHADRFASLVVQDEGGRLKPMSTVANEVVRKLTGKSTYNGMDAHQVLLGLHAVPEQWSEEPLVKIYKGKHTIEELTGLEGKYARYVDFFDEEGNFLLSDLTDEVMKKKESDRSEQDKLITDIAQRVTLMYEIFNGKHARIFPLNGDPNNKWFSHTDFDAGFSEEDSVFVYFMLPYYFNEVNRASLTGDWNTADTLLNYFFMFQKHYGAEVYPSDAKINLEILYNETEIFNKLYQYYGLVGFLFLFVLIAQMLKERKWNRFVIPMFTALVIVMFALHTLGLGVRWYISGHAPWSNAYESMVYVAWSTVLAGLIFVKRSKITLAATAIMASTFLMVAHWNWMNPEIGNLVPVLNSYWLMIHVAIIVASYGPFTLNFLLGVITLVLGMFRRKDRPHIHEQVERLSKINELIMVIGVFLLAVGTFLGGVWANESWGRYWSWDPKETWALISVMVYAFVLHMRLIPGLRGRIAFNIGAIFSYASIMMTYFGVNYYLAGMHSYAKGDPVPVPDFVYIVVSILLVLSIAAKWHNTRYEKSLE